MANKKPRKVRSPEVAHKEGSSEGAAGESGTPKYEKLRSHLISQIASGRLKPGDVVPTELQLTQSFEMARSTVRQAMAALEKDGFVRRFQGKGTFVHEDALKRLQSGLDVLALVLPQIRSGYYPSLQQSFEGTARSLHQQVIICCTHNDIDKQGHTILQLIDKRVAGVAIVPITTESTPAYQIRQLQKAGIPVVFCHRRVGGIDAPLLAIPYEELGRIAGRAVARQGHRRIAFISAGHTKEWDQYIKGVRSSLQEFGITLPDRSCHFVSIDIHSAVDQEAKLTQMLQVICREAKRPTAILTSFDSIAELLYLLLGRLGFVVPDQMSIVGFGGMVRHTPLLQRIVSVAVDEVFLGHRAVELLDQMRRGELPISHAETYELPVGITDGVTLGPVQVVP
jgi:GntR family transcriptional regulator, arabinose operon transcriptional repressor